MFLLYLIDWMSLKSLTAHLSSSMFYFKDLTEIEHGHVIETGSADIYREIILIRREIS